MYVYEHVHEHVHVQMHVRAHTPRVCVHAHVYVHVDVHIRKRGLSKRAPLTTFSQTLDDVRSPRRLPTSERNRVSIGHADVSSNDTWHPRTYNKTLNLSS